MIGFFRNVAESVVEAGVRGLLEEVPFGRYFCDVAERVLEKERQRRQASQLRSEFAQILLLSPDDARAEARSAFRAAAAEKGLTLPAAELEAAVEWIAGIPEAARVSNRRPDDPSGRTLGAAFALESPDDILKVLPPRPPRFLAGQPVPGREGEWVLERLLGVGGFGEVWLTRHTQGYHTSRAVKFFFDETGRDVEREAGLVKRAMDANRGDSGRDDDPRRHIVPILDVRLTGAAPWLMFEYVGGGNLAGWLLKLARVENESRVTQVVAALKQLCRGAGVFHGLPQPLTHRDLKPSNILVDPTTKRLRITDFGIGAVTGQAANAREGRGQTSKGERVVSYLRGAHTPTYSSPQQRRGDPPDPRDDVHAIGVIGYQLLVGRLDDGPGPRAAKQLGAIGAPADLTELLLDCASSDVADRPANALALGTRLDNIGRRKEPTVRRPDPAPRTPRPEPVRPPVLDPEPSRSPVRRSTAGAYVFWGVVLLIGCGLGLVIAALLTYTMMKPTPDDRDYTGPKKPPEEMSTQPKKSPEVPMPELMKTPDPVKLEPKVTTVPTKTPELPIPEPKKMLDVPTPEPKKTPEPKATPIVKEVLFAKEVLPILKAKCTICHGDTKSPKADLDLRSLASITKGGDNGPGVRGGDLRSGTVWQCIDDGSMPPAGRPQLSDAEKAVIRNWVLYGAK